MTMLRPVSLVMLMMMTLTMTDGDYADSSDDAHDL